MRALALGLALLLQEAALPALTGRVVDVASVLSADEEQRLSERLRQVEAETSVQIAVATVPALQGEPIEDYSIRLAESWRIGHAGSDNGILIVVVPPEREMRIEVGYGLEPVIPDGLAGRILRERMAPRFREGDYHGGLVAGVEALEAAARREFPASPEPGSIRPALDVGALFIGFVIVGLVGNALGVVAGMVGGAVVLTLFGRALLGWWSVPVGLVLGLIAVAFFRGSGGRGGWTYVPSRGGFGGPRGGGFGGGGGFSGGGGSFGGGGASGSW